MITADQIDTDSSASIIARLKSVEGQARGIQRMLDEHRDCRMILDQLLALRAASHAVTMEALTAFGTECLRQAGDDQEKVFTDLFAIVSRLTR